MMLNGVAERLRLADGSVVLLGAEEREGSGLQMNGAAYLAEFQLESGLPVWRYEIGEVRLEKRLLLPHGQNTTLITYTLTGGGGKVCLDLRPAVQLRPHEGSVSEPFAEPYELKVVEDRYEVTAPGTRLPPLRMLLGECPASFVCDGEMLEGFLYRMERGRGYDYAGSLWSPGYFQVELSPGSSATLVASTESWEVIRALQPPEAYAAELERRRRLLERPDGTPPESTTAELILAADQFIITPAGRVEDAARPGPPATRCERSSPDITGSPTGGGTR